MGRQSQPRTYASIQELAEILSISVRSARCLAKSKRLRSMPYAILDMNQSEDPKYEILRIDVNAAVQAYEAYKYAPVLSKTHRQIVRVK